MSNGWVLPEGILGEAPAYTPRPFELADLELLLTGAYAPLTGFMTRADLTSLRREGRLADGTEWSVPVTLRIPRALADQLDLENPLRRALVLTDGESAPIAVCDVTDMWPANDGAAVFVGGRVGRIGDGGRGPFQRLRRDPAEVRGMLPPGRVLCVIADRPLHRPQLAEIAHAVRTLNGHLLILIPVGESSVGYLPAEVLVRTIFAARDRMPPATIVAVPMASRGDEFGDALLRSQVAAAYGATHLLSSNSTLAGNGLRVLLSRELAYDNRDGQWRWRDDIPPRNRRLALTRAEIDDLLDRGFPLPEWHTPPAVAKELVRARPPAATAAWWSSSPGSPAPASRPSPAGSPTRCARPASAPSPCSTATWCAASSPPGSASARPTGTRTCAGSAGSRPRSPGIVGWRSAARSPRTRPPASRPATWRWPPGPGSCAL